jgi:hypothetical protein
MAGGTRKMKTTVVDGKLQVDLCALFEEMDTDEKNAVIAHLAWDSPIFEELKRGVREEYAGENYNDTIYRLRLAFLQDEDVHDKISETVKQLLRTIKHLRNERDGYSDRFWKYHHWYRDHFDATPPFDSPDYQPVDVSNEELEEVFKAMGVTAEMTEKPLKENNETETT